MMRKLPIGNMLVTLLLLLSVNYSNAQPVTSEAFFGHWAGKLALGGNALRIVINITKTTNDSVTATLDSPDQGAFGIAASRVTVEKNTVIVEMNKLGAKYSGTLQSDGITISGTFSQGSANLPLTLVKTDKVESKLNRPQEPVRPFPYKETEVSFENKSAGITLSGTLTIPEGKGKYPAVVLITGSGPQNRDEELLGHKPFMVIADFLTRNGIAVLRFDDRGYGKSKGDFSSATSFDFASDAQSGVAFLKTQSDIDSKKIGLIGHSEGGLIAPMVAVQSKDVAFIILMAGTGIPGDQIIILQSDLISAAEGVPSDILKIEHRVNERVFDVLKNVKDTVAAKKEILDIFAEFAAALPDSMKNMPQASQAYAQQQMKTFFSPWFMTFITYDPAANLEKVTCPVLALNGSLDLQVPPKENLQAIEKALKKAKNEHVVIKELPGLNHLMQKAKTGAPSEYIKIEETIAPEALDAMLQFINTLK